MQVPFIWEYIWFPKRKTLFFQHQCNDFFLNFWWKCFIGSVFQFFRTCFSTLFLIDVNVQGWHVQSYEDCISGKHLDGIQLLNCKFLRKLFTRKLVHAKICTFNRIITFTLWSIQFLFSRSVELPLTAVYYMTHLLNWIVHKVFAKTGGNFIED